MKLRKPQRRTVLAAALLLAAAIAGIGILCFLVREAGAEERYAAVVSAYNNEREEYLNLLEVSSVENLLGMPSATEPLTVRENLTRDEIRSETERILLLWEEMRYAVQRTRQITVPSASWAAQRLRGIEGVTGVQEVTAERDPNGQLGQPGGYTACVYFMYESVQETVRGADAIEKGTDGGGAVEVYRTAADAFTRCDYLSQFDGTLLYTGSCAVLGTMVIRTSYALSDEDQLLLTDLITRAFTEVERKWNNEEQWENLF